MEGARAGVIMVDKGNLKEGEVTERAIAFATAPARMAGRSRPRTPPPCPCCGQPGGFCETHRARLEQIRADLRVANRRAGGRQTIQGTRGTYEHQEDE